MLVSAKGPPEAGKRVGMTGEPIGLTRTCVDRSNKFVYNFVTMITSQNLRTITDMRKKADELLALARKSKEPIGILRNNKLEAYLIDAKVLEKLERFVENYLDSKVLAGRLDASKGRDFEDLEKMWEEEDLAK